LQSNFKRAKPLKNHQARALFLFAFLTFSGPRFSSFFFKAIGRTLAVATMALVVGVTRKGKIELTGHEPDENQIGKSTLHYLRKHAQNEKPFRTYRKVADRLQRAR
jgi:hypothetical protein